MARKSKRMGIKHHRANFYLLFKQGISGILYFKIPLIVIIVLSFLATLLLTTAMSTTGRIQNDFNQYVKTTNRFDYTYQYGVNTSTTNTKGTYYYYPSDLAPTYSAAGSSNLKDAATNYNTIFNPSEYSSIANHYGWIFDFFTNQSKLSTGTPRAGTASFISWIDKGYSQFTNIGLDVNTKKITYGNFSNFNAVPDSIKNIFIKNVSDYLSAIGNEIAKEHTYNIKDTTSFGGFSVIGYNFRQEEAQTILSKGPSVVADAVSRYINNPEINSYLLDIYQNFILWIRNQIINYFTFFVNPAIQFVKSTPADLVDAATMQTAINTYIADDTNYNGQTAGFNISVNQASGATSQPNIENLMYEFVMGSSLPDREAITNKSFLGHYYYNSASTTTLSPTYLLSSVDNIYTQGLRGMVNPLVYTGDTTKPVIKANTTELNDFKNLLIKEPFAGFTQQGTGVTAEKDFLFHQQIAAKISDFKINFRNELFLFDNSTKRQFRFVVIQNDPNDGYHFFQNQLHIIKGVRPFLSNQVAISPQYARANHIAIGNLITIGDVALYVTAYATDSYTFIPATTESSIIPNVKNNAVLYGSWTVSHTVERSGALTKQQYTEAFLNWQKTNALGVSANNLTLKNANSRYSSALMSAPKDLFYSNSNLAHPGNAGDPALYNSGSTANLKFTAFNDSNYHFNWTLLPLGLQIFAIVAYAASAILMLLVLIAIWIAVSKSIRRQATQIGILKAMGNSNFTISCSYLVYTILIVALIIPLGWVLGIVAQWPTAELFQTFFSLNYLQIFIDWRPLVIALGVFGAASLFVTFYSSFRILRQNVTVIMKPGVYWRNNRIVMFVKRTLFAKAGFLRKFRINVVSNSVRSIFIIFSVILIGSFLITTSLTLPVLIQNISNSYFKNIKYKNSYNYRQPTFNMPLARINNKYWPGLSSLKKDFSSTGGFDPLGGVNVQPGYNKVADYWSSTNGSSAVPYIINPNPTSSSSWQWTSDYMSNNFSQAIDLLEQAFGSNIFMSVGRSFNLGLVDGLIDGVYHSTEFKDDSQSSGINITKRTSALTNIDTTFNAGLGKILKLIFNNPAGQGSWRDQIIHVLLNSLPPFIGNYVYSSPDRKEQFMFGWSLSLAVQGEDSFTTDANTISKQGAVQAIGVSPSSQIINFPSGTPKKDIIIPNASIQALQKALNTYQNNQSTSGLSDITLNNGVKLYDHATNTVNIPVYANAQVAAQFDYSSSHHYSSNFVPQQNATEFLNKNNQWTIIPKQWWSYDDSDFAKSILGQNIPKDYFNNPATGHSYSSGTWLDPYEIPSGAMTYNAQYSDNNPSFGFVDHYVDPKSGKVTPIVRPDYEFNNLHLFIPADEINQQIFKDPSNLGALDLDPNIFETVPKTEVPQSVTQSAPNVQTWAKIAPYNLQYDPRFDPILNAPLSNLTNKYIAWIDAALAGTKQVMRVTSVNASINSRVQNNDIYSVLYPHLHFRYDILGVLPTYGNKSVFTDARLVNQILGYSLSKNYNYQLSDILDPNNTAKQSNFHFVNSDVNEVVSNSSIYPNNKFAFNANNAPLTWGNALYSEDPEPLALTNLYSISQYLKTGAYFSTRTHDDLYPYGSTISSSELLSAKELYIQRITTICLSISIVMLSFIIISAVLLILLISSIFVSQYQRFMVLMKTDGYTRTQIIRNTINVFTPYVLIAWALGSFFTWLVIHLVSNYAYTTLALAVPITLAWWVFLVSFVLVAAMYSAVFVQMSRKLKNNTVELLRESQRHQ